MNYISKSKVLFSDVDSNLNLDVIHKFEKTQNNVTDFLALERLDNESLKEDTNSILVIAKNVLKFYNESHYKDDIIGDTHFTKITNFRYAMETVFKDSNDNLLWICKTESCRIDFNGRSVIPLDKKPQTNDEVLSLKYSNLYNVSDFIFKESINVKSLDIDFSAHVNNVSYIKYILNCLPFKFFSSHKLNLLEIHYLHEALYGQKLDIYTKEENNIIYFLLKNDDTEIVRAKVIYD